MIDCNLSQIFLFKKQNIRKRYIELIRRINLIKKIIFNLV